MKILNFYIFVLLLVIVFNSCEKNDNTIDSEVITPLSISFSEISPQKIIVDTMQSSISAVKDTLSTSNISLAVLSDQTLTTFFFKFTDPYTTLAQDYQQVTTFQKQNLGNSFLYKMLLPLKIKKSNIGIYKVDIQAGNGSGNYSNILFTSFEIYRRENHAPVLISVDAPKTIILTNEIQYITLTVKVSDEEGLADIAKVLFNSYLPPNGLPSSSNPFLMYDDGNLDIYGDITAGDGIYSRIIQLPPTVTKGVYRFEFEATDKSNIKSNVIPHYLTVN